MKVGEIISFNKTIELNRGRKTISIEVKNSGDRPVQVGSHFHFFEVNKALCFERKAAFGFRLDIPSGMSVRFEPGETKTVQLCSFGGKSEIYGLNNLTNGRAVAGGEK
ncbi:MAG: urease subunit beta [Treponema sp.]|nr:urease subunit beta [Treponema sp.]